MMLSSQIKVFINATKKLKLAPFRNSFDTYINQITFVFKDRVSIRNIQKCFSNIETNYFNFRHASLKKVKSEVLNSNKKSHPLKIPYLQQ